MLVEIPSELIDKALAAVGLVPTECRDGIMQTAFQIDCADCRTKPAATIDGTSYCARHANQILKQRIESARGLT